MLLLRMCYSRLCNLYNDVVMICYSTLHACEEGRPELCGYKASSASKNPSSFLALRKASEL